MKIKIRKIQQEIYAALLKQKCSTRFRSRINDTKKDLIENCLNITVSKLSNLKSIKNPTIDSK